MGITSFSTGLVNRVLDNRQDINSVIELGAQNMYDQDYNGNFPYADGFYTRRGLTYECIDLSGENGAQAIDLSEPCAVSRQYDMVTDFGTSEHVRGIYNCWKTKHDLLRVGGVMVNENPKVGNWPDHGYHYYTEEFYTNLCEVMGYKIIELGEHPAMGNTVNGWNIYCVLEKVEDKEFVSPELWEGMAPSKGPKLLAENEATANLARAIVDPAKEATKKPKAKAKKKTAAAKGKKGSSKSKAKK